MAEVMALQLERKVKDESLQSYKIWDSRGAQRS